MKKPPRLTEQVLARATKPEKARWKKRAKDRGIVTKGGKPNLSAYLRALANEDAQ